MLILHNFSDARPAEQRQTVRAMRLLRQYGYRVEDMHCAGDDGYTNNLLKYWNDERILVNIEQDIIPHIFNLDDFAYCPELACTFPYRLKDGRWSIFELGKIYPIDDPQTPDIARDLYFHDQAIATTTEGSGFGFIKLMPELRSQIDLAEYPVERWKWTMMDVWLSCRMKEFGINWHVHYPPVTHIRGR